MVFPGDDSGTLRRLKRWLSRRWLKKWRGWWKSAPGAVDPGSSGSGGGTAGVGASFHQSSRLFRKRHCSLDSSEKWRFVCAKLIMLREVWVSEWQTQAPISLRQTLEYLDFKNRVTCQSSFEMNSSILFDYRSNNSCIILNRFIYFSILEFVVVPGEPPETRSWNIFETIDRVEKVEWSRQKY